MTACTEQPAAPVTAAPQLLLTAPLTGMPVTSPAALLAALPEPHITTTMPLRGIVQACEQAAAALSDAKRRGTRVRLQRVGTYRLEYTVTAGRGTLGHVSVSFCEHTGPGGQASQTALWVEGTHAAVMHAELAGRIGAAPGSQNLELQAQSA